MLTPTTSASSASAAGAPLGLTRAQIATLALIAAVGLAIRLTALYDALQSPGYRWEDPDGYMTQALRLAGDGRWRWTFDAVTYAINNQRHALPPMYSVFLSIFALFPGFPLTAQIAQVVLSIASILLVFALGRRLHSISSGLIAAGAYALWVPNIFNVWSTSQETLYVPLILGSFLLLARALDDPGSWRAFLLAGVAFGAAALTRSMPLFFVLPAAALHVWSNGFRRRAALQAVAFVVGFALLTAPYSMALSRHFGQTTIIDTHGSIHLESASGTRAPGLFETAAGLWRAMSADPGAYFSGCLARAKSLLHVNGGRILQIYVVAESKASAILWKTLVHLGADMLLIVGVVLASLGAVLCRRRNIAAFLLLWAAINIGIASLGGFGGARLRAPFEPLLAILAAVVFAGGWQRPRPVALAAALATGALAAIAVLPQLPASLRSWPDYGMAWPSIFNRPSGTFTSAAGLNVPAFDGRAAFDVTSNAQFATRLQVRVGGVHVNDVALAAGETATIRTMWPARGLAYIELDQHASANEPAVIAVTIPGR